MVENVSVALPVSENKLFEPEDQNAVTAAFALEYFTLVRLCVRARGHGQHLPAPLAISSAVLNNSNAIVTHMKTGKVSPRAHTASHAGRGKAHTGFRQ